MPPACRKRLNPRVLPSVILLAVIAAGAVLSGCAGVDPAVQRTQQTADLLVGTRESMLTSDQSVAQSQVSLRTLNATQGDLRPAFDAFLLQLQAVRKQADRLKHESEIVRTESRMYCAARQSDISTINNDDMRHAAEVRTANIKEKCDDIRDRYTSVNTGFTRYIRSLADLQTYLGNELTYSSLNSGKKWVDQAISDGELLRSDIRALSLEIEVTSNLLSPIPLAATQWPTDLHQPDALADR